jgi:hypothetical protein
MAVLLGVENQTTHKKTTNVRQVTDKLHHNPIPVIGFLDVDKITYQEPNYLIYSSYFIKSIYQRGHHGSPSSYGSCGVLVEKPPTCHKSLTNFIT